MKSFLIPAYTFTPGASGVGTVDLSAIPSFNMKRLVAIINQTDGILIYSTANPALGFTNESAGVVTLFFDTTAMSAGDRLQIIYEDMGVAAAASSSPVALCTEQAQNIADIETLLTSISVQLPAALGPDVAADSLSVVLASDQAAIPNAIIAGTITNAKVTVGTTAVRATVSGAAPSAVRKKLMIKPFKDNTGVIYLGSSSVTTANGMEIIGPDRLEFMFDASDYYLRSDTAGQAVEIIEVI